MCLLLGEGQKPDRETKKNNVNKVIKLTCTMINNSIQSQNTRTVCHFIARARIVFFLQLVKIFFANIFQSYI